MIKGYPLQKFLLLQGPGGNGKSVLINFISAILGEKENVSNMTLDTLENEKFGRVHLYGKHLNAFADIDASFFKNSSFIKALTGDDYIYAEYKGRDEQLIVLIQIFNQAHIKAQLENPPQTAPNTSPK
ncbi:hypothetical protein KW850_16955 [Bacillus sp. sid0103]|uniref:DUF5906 domain-containing protein n=1 Tax=Bacillus sp. sid0103 TaxID=2856337 RepID=UPI001C4726F1|nr:DUF5906 domain-containing protein [Bacillus sp. sid0103]MBV7506953.1 hypothetical protein [Bacillus sp. sid0103]